MVASPDARGVDVAECRAMQQRVAGFGSTPYPLGDAIVEALVIRSSWLMVGVVLLAAGCSNPEIEAKVKELESRVEKLESAPKAAPAGRQAAPAAPVDEAKEQGATEMLRTINELVEKRAYDDARGKLAQLDADFPGTRAQRAAQRIKEEVDVIGRDAGAMTVDSWYQGKVDMNDGKATMLVFWEVWCPHCKREVPKLQATHDKYKGRGLNMVGLTKQTRGVTDDQVREFITEGNVSYPMAREAGDELSTRFGVRGIPAAAVVKGGKVVWRGHPSRVTDQMIEEWVN